MRYWQSAESHASWLRPWVWAAAGASVLVATAVWAQGFAVERARAVQDGDRYLLEAYLDLDLSNASVEALYNEVPLTFTVEVEVIRPRKVLWDRKVAAVERQLVLRYHAMSKRFLVQDAPDGPRISVASLDKALERLGTISRWPIVAAKKIKPNKPYLLRVRALLDIESLPPPLRPIAYMSSDWRLVSEWYECPLRS